MDQSFLGDVLALAGEEGVRVALAKCEAIFRLQEPKKRMRDQAAHVCRALCRTRVVGGNVSTPRNADRRALEAGLEHHRPAESVEHARAPLPAALVRRRGRLQTG